MKNRLFPISMSLCFVLLIAVVYLRAPNPQTEAPVETEPAQESVNPTNMFQTENATRSHGH